MTNLTAATETRYLLELYHDTVIEILEFQNKFMKRKLDAR